MCLGMKKSVYLWQVYADYESNPLLRQGIEFCCRQFYILHRKPFILQLFASVAPLLEFTVRLWSQKKNSQKHKSAANWINYLLNLSIFTDYSRQAPVQVCRKVCPLSVSLTCWSPWRGKPRTVWTLWSWSRLKNLFVLLVSLNLQLVVETCRKLPRNQNLMPVLIIVKMLFCQLIFHQINFPKLREPLLFLEFPAGYSQPNICFILSDFCYGNEDLAFSISEAIKLCVTVFAYAPESFRRWEKIPTRPLLLNNFQTSNPSAMLCLQSPDADGAGSVGSLPPPEAQE